MTKLTLKLVLLFSIPGWFLLPALVVVLASYEAMPFSVIVRKHLQKTPTLVGLLFTESKYWMKMRATIQMHPEILAIGSSRVMPVREVFFKPGQTFYNAGGAIMNTYGFSPFMEQLDKSRWPKLIVLQLDHWAFSQLNDRPDIGAPEKGDLFREFNLDTSIASGIGQLLAPHNKEILSHWKEFLNPFEKAGDGLKKVGLHAIYKDVGFLNDGSYHFGFLMRKNLNPIDIPDYKFENTLERVRTKTAGFQEAKTYDPKKLAVLESFLDECKARGTHVVGYLATLPPKINQAMEKEKEKYQYVYTLPNVLRKSFSARGFSFFDFIEARKIGAGDEEFTDGLHAGEKATLRAFIEMAKMDPILGEKSESLEYLETRLKNAPHPFLVFQPEERLK